MQALEDTNNSDFGGELGGGAWGGELGGGSWGRGGAGDRREKLSKL